MCPHLNLQPSEEVTIAPFYEEPERLTNLPKMALLPSSRAEVQTQAVTFTPGLKELTVQQW